MMPRKSSTLIKKGQSLLKNKQGVKVKNDQIQNERVQYNFVSSVKHQQNNNISIKNPNIITNNIMKRTFIKKSATNSLVGQNLPKTTTIVNNSSLYNHSKVIKNSVGKSLVNSRPWENQKQANTQQKIIKTPLRKITNGTSLHQQKITKSKVFNVSNPEQKKLTIMNPAHKNANMQMLNTRKSKFERDENLKNLKREEQKSNGVRSNQIKIHTVKNVGSKASKRQSQRGDIKKDTNIMTGQIRLEQQREVENNKDSCKEKKKQQQEVIECQSQLISGTQLVQHTEDIFLDSNQQVQISNVASTVFVNQLPANQHHSHHSLSSHLANSPQSRQILEAQNPNLSSNLLDQNIVSQIQQQNPPQNQPDQRNIDLASLISNTQDIIDFINRLNLRNRIQAFDLMVTQLTQLNLIAQQVHELGQIGNTLGYSLVNVFGTRIRELQTTIINQVGIALIASFQERIDPQFQALVIRQPSLRNGFSKADIQKTFDEKFAFKEVECSICLENVKEGQKVLKLQCHHEFHPICIKTWLQNSKKCPLCRTEQKRKEV